MLRVYKEGDHGGGFVGIRVAVSVNAKLRQKYYSFRSKDKERIYITKREEKALLEEAKTLDAKWQAEQKPYENKRKLEVVGTKAKPRIIGLRLVPLVVSKRSVYYPDLSIAIVGPSGTARSVTRKSVIKDYDTYLSVWKEKAKALSVLRGCKRIPRDWSRCILTESQYKYIRRKVISEAKKKNAESNPTPAEK